MIAPVAKPSRGYSRTGETLRHRYLKAKKRHREGIGPYVCPHVPNKNYPPTIQVSSSSFYPSPLLHPPSFIFFPAHASCILPSTTSSIHGCSHVRCGLLHSLLPPLLFPSPTTPPLFLSLSNFVRHREWIDSGSVFIGSVFSTACSRAPLRG